MPYGPRYIVCVICGVLMCILGAYLYYPKLPFGWWLLAVVGYSSGMAFGLWGILQRANTSSATFCADYAGDRRYTLIFRFLTAVGLFVVLIAIALLMPGKVLFWAAKILALLTGIMIVSFFWERLAIFLKRRT